VLGLLLRLLFEGEGCAAVCLGGGWGHAHVPLVPCASLAGAVLCCAVLCIKPPCLAAYLQYSRDGCAASVDTCQTY
jgi:hypothetical protein